MPAWFELDLAGQTMRLSAERALYWPARRRLFIADLHLGKGDTFRAHGIAVPSGGSAHDLARLSALLEETGATSLWILGDMLHSAQPGQHWRQAWQAFTQRHAGLAIHLIAGNHDRAADKADLRICIHTHDVTDEPFVLTHHPLPADARTSDGLHRLCGHQHPVMRAPGLPGRYPVFVLDKQQTILPAFSAFTGGWRVDTGSVPMVACVHGQLLVVGCGG